ncbi:hypothetical protein SDC9_89507 [bioreactor metagenome]|uniref:Uncharacterized protein n=1 Tax=bioreactor metagenome TaxID=1076179 RepID=A0A644ZPM1_9ZZZZ
MDEILALLGHYVVLLLGHGAAHKVAPAVGVARKRADDFHDLLLIHHAAVGRAQNGLEQRVRVDHARGVVLALDVARNLLHRAGAVEGNARDKVLKAVGFELAKELPHAAGFQLKHPVGIPGGDHAVNGGVVERQSLQIGHLLSVLGNKAQRIANHRERPQAQKVHLEQAELFQRGHWKLRCDNRVVELERHNLGNRHAGDYNARRVGRAVAGKTFQLERKVNNLLCGFVALVVRLEFGRNGEGAFERHVQLGGYHFGEAVHVRIRHAEHAPNVTYDRARGHCSKRDDLADVACAVFCTDVVYNFLPALIAEVDIEVRHADALGVKEALEQEIIFERIDVRNVQTVRNKAARAAAAPGADHDAVHFGKMDEIPNDEEVVHKPHLLDHAKLIFEPFADGIIRLREFFCQPIGGQLAEIRGVWHAVRCGELGEPALAELDFQIAFFNDFRRGFQRFRIVRQSTEHLLRRLEVELVALHAHAVGLVYKPLGLDAEQNILRFRVVRGNIVHVVGGDALCADIARNLP